MNSRNSRDNVMRTNQAILCGGLIHRPRLTPTGKISHAKTRVYTQRYRKEWEQMPDFRGWLTSVPDQATRAYCTFCKKNLHAHRLSLLKHTCTMKHQRAALTHQNEMNARRGTAVKIAEIEGRYEEQDADQESMMRKESDEECEEDNEEFEYVVETLEMEDDELDNSRCREQQIDAENIDNYDEDGNMTSSGDYHHRSLGNTKIKIEREEEDCRDTLAHAMAHVHGEYFDSPEEQVSVQMEMAVGEDEAIHESENDASINSMEDDGDESQNNENVKRSIIREKSSGDCDSSEIGSDSEVSPVQRLEEIGKSFRNLKDVMNSSKLSAAVQSSFGTPVSVPSGQTKTIKLNSGKTVTLRAGAQYVLGNLKGKNISSLLKNDRKVGAQNELSVKSEESKSSAQKSRTYTAVAGTSKQSSNQESGKTEGMKKPCISTHVLDTSKGLPVGGLQVSLYKLMDGRWTFLNESNTSPNGRCNDLVDCCKSSFTAGRYKMHFDVDKYFTLRRIETLYPFIEIVFDVKNPTGHYHIPVLLSPFGYTTYRGS